MHRLDTVYYALAARSGQPGRILGFFLKRTSKGVVLSFLFFTLAASLCCQQQLSGAYCFAASLAAIGAGAFILSKVDPGFSDFMGAASVKVPPSGSCHGLCYEFCVTSILYSSYGAHMHISVWLISQGLTELRFI